MIFSFFLNFLTNGYSIGFYVSCIGIFGDHHYFRDQIGQRRASAACMGR